MKKILLVLFLSSFLFSCSDDDKVGKYEFYIVNTENIPCIEEAIREKYANKPELAEERIKMLTTPHKSFMELTDKGAKQGVREMENEAALDAPNCPPSKYAYRKVG